MSVDDLVYKLCNSELYEIKINGVTYGKVGDITANVLNKNVSNWGVTTSTVFENLFCLEIDTWDFYQLQLTNNILRLGFCDAQINSMIKSGISLSTIVDMTLSLDTVIDSCDKMGYKTHQIRPNVYEIYADRLITNLNNFLIGSQITEPKYDGGEL